MEGCLRAEHFFSCNSSLTHNKLHEGSSLSALRLLKKINHGDTNRHKNINFLNILDFFNKISSRLLVHNAEDGHISSFNTSQDINKIILYPTSFFPSFALSPVFIGYNNILLCQQSTDESTQACILGWFFGM